MLGLLPLRDDDIEIAIEAWSEMLYGACIPLPKLAGLFFRAISEHKGKRNLVVTEVLDQWHSPADASPPVKHNGDDVLTSLQDLRELCRVCNGSKFEVVPGKGARPCGHCVDKRGVRTGREPIQEVANETLI